MEDEIIDKIVTVIVIIGFIFGIFILYAFIKSGLESDKAEKAAKEAQQIARTQQQKLNECAKLKKSADDLLNAWGKLTVYDYGRDKHSVISKMQPTEAAMYAYRHGWIKEKDIKHMIKYYQMIQRLEALEHIGESDNDMETIRWLLKLKERQRGCDHGKD